MSEEAVVNSEVEADQVEVEAVEVEEPSRPEWLLPKYKSVEDQAKSYTELQKKFGGFTGAPEKYELAISDEMREMGFDVDADDPLIGELNEFAKSINMSQEAHSGLVELYGKVNLAQAQWAEEFKANEMKALGSSAQARIDSIAKWGKANLDPEIFEGLTDAAVSAGAVRAIEALIARTRNAPQVGKDVPTAPAVSRGDWEQKRFAEKDAHGQLRYKTDASFRAEVDAMRGELFGMEEHRTIVG